MENMTTPAVYHDAGATDDEWERFFKSVDVMSAVIYSLVCVLGVLGNGMVIWVTCFKMKGGSVNRVWYINLAVADFFTTFFLPLNITQRALGNQWPFGWFMCKMDSMVFYFNMYDSIYILVLISVDRCLVMIWPVWCQNNRTIIKAHVAMLGVHAMAVALSIPHVISRELDFGLCFDYPDPPLVLTNLLVGFVFPFFVIVSCYSLICRRIRQISQEGRITSITPYKIIAAIIAAFFLCWAPYHSIRLIYVVVTKFGKTLDVVLEFAVPISLTLALLNSCLNPLLYAFMSRSYKDVFCRSFLSALEKAFAEDLPINTHTELQLKDVFLAPQSPSPPAPPPIQTTTNCQLLSASLV